MTTPKNENSGTIDSAVIPASAVSISKGGRYYAVAERELTSLMKLEKPKAYLCAAGSAGVFVGTIGQAIDAFQASQTAVGVDTGGLMFVLTCGLSFGIAVASTFIAVQGRSEIARALEAIQGRPQVAVPYGHPAAPAHSATSKVLRKNKGKQR